MKMTPLIVAVLDLIEADTAIRAITGFSAGDTRVYRYLHSDAVINVPAGKRAYITYEAIATPREMGGVTEPVLSFSIWGPDIADLLVIEDRLAVLFQKKDITIEAGVVVRGTRIQALDAAHPRTSFDGREVHYKFGQLTSAV